MASYIDLNDLGSFANINALWAAYPEGGQEGDYCTIDGVKYRWDKYDRMWVANPNFGPTHGRRVDTFYGDVNMQNNLTVAGYIRAKGIKQPCVGLFASLAALEAKWPDPEAGMWALVGDSISNTSPAAVYRCNTDGTWAATGGTAYLDGLEFNVDKAVTGWVPISSTSQLPTDPTPDQQGRGYLLGTMLYVYVGEGGDTLSGKYQSAQLKGATGETGPQGPSGVHEDDVTIADNLATDDPLQVLSARQGKKLKEYIFSEKSEELSGTNTASAKIDNNGVINTGNAGYGFITTIAITSSIARVRIYGNCAGYSKSAYAFYNDTTLLEKGGSFSGDSSVDVDTSVDVPENATKLVLSNNNASTASMHAERLYDVNNIEELENDVETLQDAVEDIEDSVYSSVETLLQAVNTEGSKKITNTGTIASGSDAYGTLYRIPITEDIGHIHLYGSITGTTRSAYAFFDEDDTLLLYGGVINGNDQTISVDDIVETPTGADYLLLSYNKSVGNSKVEARKVETTSDASSVYLNDYTSYQSNSLFEQTVLRQASEAKAEGRMIFEDDFNGYNINEGIWNVDEGQFLSRTAYVNAKENVWVENSILHISATRRNRYGKCAMGQITTKGKYDFCGHIRIEGKFRMPTVSCFWPAFWTWGTDTYAYSRGGGAYAELDLFELFGSASGAANGRVSSHLWTGDAAGDGTQSGLTDLELPLFTNNGEWHIYRADIYEDKVVMSVDGEIKGVYVLSDDKKKYIYTMRQYVLVSVQYWDRDAVTEDLDGATLECDWVRVYALDDTDIMPSSITVDSILSMTVGQKARLVPTLGTCHDKTTTYDIVNESIVGHGDIVHSELVAKAAGTTDVYVTTKNRKSAKCTVTVS